MIILKTKSRWSNAIIKIKKQFWLTFVVAAKKAAPAKKAVKKTVAKKAVKKVVTKKAGAKKAAPKKKTTTKKAKKWSGYNEAKKNLAINWRVLFDEPVSAVLSAIASYSMFLSSNKRLYIQPMFSISFHFKPDEHNAKISRQKRELLSKVIVEYFSCLKIISVSSLSGIYDACYGNSTKICDVHISAHRHATEPFSVDPGSPRLGEQGATAATSVSTVWTERKESQMRYDKLDILINVFDDLCFMINGLKL